MAAMAPPLSPVIGWVFETQTNKQTKSPLTSHLRSGVVTRQPSKRHHSHSLLGFSFHDPRIPHVLESHPERAAPFSRRDDKRRHSVGSHCALALHLYLAACNHSPRCRFWVLDHLFSNLSQPHAIVIPFEFCRITETLSFNLCVCGNLLLFFLCSPDRNAFQL